MDRQPTSAGTIDEGEVARFSRLASQWWDPGGPMAPLHKFNPVRLAGLAAGGTVDLNNARIGKTSLMT